MSHYEQRSKEAPMDIDSLGHEHGRLGLYQNHNNSAFDEGPARKRPHTDLENQPSFVSPSTPSRPHYTSNTPFFFNAANFTPKSTYSYNPAQYAGGSKINFGFASQAEEAKSQEVEMATDSPARAPLGETNQPNTAAAAAVAESSATGAASAKAEAASVESAAEPVEEERPMARGAIQRVMKRRQEGIRRRRRRNESDDEDEEDYSDGGTPSRFSQAVSRRERNRDRDPSGVAHSKSEHHYTLHMPTPAVAHSELPAILLGYVQFIFNATLVLVFLFIVIQVILTIRKDVQDKYEEYSTELLQEIAACSNLYLVNGCDPATRVPAMEPACKNWEACMSRDPTVVGRARLSAETLGEIVNGFVEPISWKTLIFSLSTLACLITVTNSALFNLRARHQPQPLHHPQPPMPPLPDDVQRLQQMGGQQVGWQAAKRSMF